MAFAPAVIKELPSAIVKVEPLAGAVIATLFTDVADATPNSGVTKVGDVALTTSPVPVVAISSITPAY